MKPISVARDLQRRRGRERSGLFTAEGVRCVEELLASPIRIRGALTSPSLSHTPRGQALEATLRERSAIAGFELTTCSDDLMADVAGTDTPQGVLVIAEQAERTFENVDHGGVVLVLDGVQDPGNVGTILRTAEAFGVAATVALPGTADLWNPKVVRSAMGALFAHTAFAATMADTVLFLRECSIPVWTTSAAGEPLAGRATLPSVAIVVGNEASGVSDEMAAIAERNVAIPVHGVESLNVAVATGILLYAITTG